MRKLSNGVVHKLPNDLRNVLRSNDTVVHAWEDITPLARNEWICFVLDAKQAATREKRIEKMFTDLMQGKRRPCCWAGCKHR